MSYWDQLLNCKECGKLPYVVPIKGKNRIMCDHGGQKTGIVSHEGVEAWNQAQLDLKECK